MKKITKNLLLLTSLGTKKAKSKDLAFHIKFILFGNPAYFASNHSFVVSKSFP